MKAYAGGKSLQRWQVSGGADPFGTILQIAGENQHHLALAGSIDHPVGIGF